MAIQRSSTSKSLVKVMVAAALGMLLSKSGSLPPVAVGPSTVRVYHYTNFAGYQGILRGENKKDRADYVFALDLPKSSVVFVDTDGNRSVLYFGDGYDVSLREVTHHGPADHIALEVKREKLRMKFQKFLSPDSILAKLGSSMTMT